MRMVIISLLLSSLLSHLFAEDDQAYLRYSIPPDAQKFTSVDPKDPRLETVSYFLAGHPLTLANRIAVEEYENGKVISRELYKDQKKHGIQRSWDNNEHWETEWPYENGVMNGTFKTWSGFGRLLVGQGVFKRGTGRILIYDREGRIVEDSPYTDNLKDGMSMVRFGKEILLQKFAKDKLVGLSSSFNDDGTLTLFGFDDFQISSGPEGFYSDEGKLVSLFWRLKGKDVKEAKYAAAAAANPALPPYFADHARYKDWVLAQMRPTLNHYQTMPRVKIPLEFDQAGNAIPAN